MKYTLRQLQVFLAVAHYENVTKAAESLTMSQSAASGSLKELEQQFALQLFDRVGKRLRVNSQGALLRPKAEALMSQAREIEDELLGHQQVGSLRIGATMTIGNSIAVDLVSEFMALYPQANIGLSVANTRTIAESVRNFDVDIGLVEGELHHPELDVLSWRDDELVVFCAPKHPYASKEHLTDDDLKAVTWVLRESGSGTRQGFDRAMHGLLPHMRIAMELQHAEAICRAVETGMGISCLSAITVEKPILRGDLVPLKVPHRNLKRAFYFVLHKNKYRDTAVENWLQLCSK